MQERKMGTATNSLPITALETNHVSLKRIGWLYPIFRDLHFYHGLLGDENIPRLDSTRQLQLRIH